MDSLPEHKSEYFKCPHCQVLSQQIWFDVDSSSSAANQIINHVYLDYRSQVQSFKQEAIASFIERVVRAYNIHMPEFVPNGFSVATCTSCNQISLWVNEEIVYPRQTAIAPPNEDMEQEIKELYIEASTIVVDSPKGATALLRLALQLLLKQLGKSGKNINNDIKELVADGLSPKIQKALDLLRVVGNNAVHPGQIDLDDGRDIAFKLFHVLNFIAEEMISKPKELDFLYSDIVPEETQEHINQRDGK
ncbi:DUF4145 domain-containing protein [Vibrio parahaemolyticus]|nr:DUF4145 domain-containing protein [Vibrio parahaemolyticus]EJC6733398.1 DUF4145 domain-containing protein [Vibrio parahaemolyticus]EJC6946752.1 DUF4145 domain-containing protein [Vibrio parahaemolyticus]EJC7032765.1 DUF4145 domain-containing protein [Vibrio parahaemolyticus]EJC7071717.1 DUF4145 domain-containing protein [Vibrio parahaemolyticus]